MTHANYSGAAVRPWSPRVGRRLRGVVNRLIAGSSLVSTAPVLDVRDFAWTAALRRDWIAIRDEARAVALHRGTKPETWRSFSLWDYGAPVDDHLASCPHTGAAIMRIPGLTSACFSVLAPETHIPAHHGATKRLITCHLALIVPRDSDVRMRVHDRVMRWAEGETLVFDDTYEHEVWNDTSGARVVLLIRFERPMRRAGRWIADLLLGAFKRLQAVDRASPVPAPALIRNP